MWLHRVLPVEHLLLLLELVIEVVASLHHHHSRVRSEVIVVPAIHIASWPLPLVVHASTPLLWHLPLHRLAPLEILILLVVLLGAVAASNHTDVVSLERVLARSITHSSRPSHNRLVHHDAIVWVFESPDVLQILDLTFKHGQVICEHLPVELLADVLVSSVLLVLLFSGIVDVAVEHNELMPLLQVLPHVVHVLLTYLQEVLTTGKVIQHDHSTDFVEKLLLEILAFIEKFLNLLGSLR